MTSGSMSPPSPPMSRRWDSLAHITIMVAVEAEYGVFFSSEQLGAFADLGELQAFLSERRDE